MGSWGKPPETNKEQKEKAAKKKKVFHAEEEVEYMDNILFSKPKLPEPEEPKRTYDPDELKGQEVKIRKCWSGEHGRSQFCVCEYLESGESRVILAGRENDTGLGFYRIQGSNKLLSSNEFKDNLFW